MKITQELIDQTLQTGRKNLMPTFAIVKDRQKNLINKEVHTVYLAVTEPNIRNCTEISKTDALELIELFRMKPFNECKYGAVYDTEDMKYREKYRGHVVNL